MAYELPQFETDAHGCTAVFQWLGLRDPVTEHFHRAFSSAVYS